MSFIPLLLDVKFYPRSRHPHYLISLLIHCTVSHHGVYPTALCAQGAAPSLVMAIQRYGGQA